MGIHVRRTAVSDILRRVSFKCSSVLLLLGSTVPFSDGHAATLPAAQCEYQSGDGGEFGPASLCGGPSYSKVVAYDPAGDTYGVGGAATLTYDYEVVAPQTSSVTVSIQATLSAGALGGILASADAATSVQGAGGVTDTFSVFYGYSGSGAVNCQVDGSSVPCGSTTVLSKEASQIQVVTNTPYQITLFAQAGAQGSIAPTAQSSSAVAYADPLITVDPTQCPGCSVELSPGMVNQITPVPLPAAAWLLFSGLGMLGALKRGLRSGP